MPDESQFEEPELRFLLDSIASSTQIPTGKMRKDLLRKVALLASESETIENIETIKNHAKILENFHVRHKEGSTKETNQQFF